MGKQYFRDVKQSLHFQTSLKVSEVQSYLTGIGRCLVSRDDTIILNRKIDLKLGS